MLIFNIKRDFVGEHMGKGIFYERYGNNVGHIIGGYANFAEEDPRNNADYKDYNIMLLQIESQFNNKNSIWEISWGDAGVANFFITKDQLKKQDFSKVLFYWSSL